MKEGNSIEQPGLLKECIESERLLLIPISMQYKEEIFKEYSPEVTKYMNPPPKDIFELQELIEKSRNGLREGSDLQFVILTKGSQEFLGCGGLHNVDSKIPEMGVWLKKTAHGHGYGTEAMTVIKKWADDNLNYDYILYSVAGENIPSRKIAEVLSNHVECESDKNNIGGLVYKIYPNRFES